MSYGNDQCPAVRDFDVGLGVEGWGGDVLHVETWLTEWRQL